MQIFNKKNTQKNPNLTLAALKLIEMMSIVQLEEFYINQWVFLFDCKYFIFTLFNPSRKTLDLQLSQQDQAKITVLLKQVTEPKLLVVKPSPRSPTLSINHISQALFRITSR